ncbi:MbtH family protein [Nesterenkonia populi]
MPQNPFDDASGSFYALINAEEQHSLWPTFKPVPAGWSIAYGAPDGAARDEVLEWIEQNWTDLKPRSHREQIAKHSSAARPA